MNKQPESSQGDSERWLVPIGIIGGGILLVRFVGWVLLLKLFGWLVVIAAGLGAVGMGWAAWESKQEDERVGFGVVAGVCAIVALVAFWLVGGRGTDAPEPLDPRLAATSRYWSDVPACLSAGGDRIETRSQMIRVFREAASRIESLPTQDVDPVAVDWGLEAAASLRQFAAAAASIEAQQEQMVVRSFLYGASGNLVGGVQDIAGTLGQTDERARAATERFEYVWDQRRAQVRAQLTETYGTQFP